MFINAFQLLFSEPSAAPSNVKLQSSTSSSLTISWDTVFCSYRNGAITSYTYRLYTSSGNTVEVTDDTPMTSVTISDLLPNTQYYFSVGARTEGGDGPTSGDIMFQTMSKSPDCKFTRCKAKMQ